MTYSEDFDLILRDPLGLRLFTEYLQKEFSGENIKFWNACQNFKNLPARKRLEAARDIYRQHLELESPEPVNVVSAVREEVAAAISSHEQVDKFLFDKAQKEIYRLMKMDSFPRFLASSIFRELSAPSPVKHKRSVHLIKEKRDRKEAGTEATDQRRWPHLPFLSSLLQYRSNNSSSSSNNINRHSDGHNNNSLSTNNNNKNLSKQTENKASAVLKATFTPMLNRRRPARRSKVTRTVSTPDLCVLFLEGRGGLTD